MIKVMVAGTSSKVVHLKILRLKNGTAGDQKRSLRSFEN